MFHLLGYSFDHKHSEQIYTEKTMTYEVVWHCICNKQTVNNGKRATTQYFVDSAHSHSTTNVACSFAYDKHHWW